MTLPPVLVGDDQKSAHQTETLDDGITSFGSGVGGTEKSEGDGRVSQKSVGPHAIGFGIVMRQRAGQENGGAAAAISTGGRRRVGPQTRHIATVRRPPLIGEARGRTGRTRVTGATTEFVVRHMVGTRTSGGREGKPTRPEGCPVVFSYCRLTPHVFLSAAPPRFFNVRSTTRRR